MHNLFFKSHAKKIAGLQLTLLISLFSASSVANDDYQAWLKQTRGEFKTYLDENDKAFMQLLNAKWQQVDIEPAKKLDVKPKPVVMPRVTPATSPVKDPVDAAIDSPEVVAPPIAVPIAAPADKSAKSIDDEFTVAIKPQDKKPVATPKPLVSAKSNETLYKFDYFGEQIVIAADKKFKTVFNGRVDSQSLADYWKKIAVKPHKNIIQQLEKTAQRLQLNSWGKAMLVDSFSRAVQGFGASRKLTSWFLLTKIGFDARIAYNSDVYLLLPSEQAIYGKTFFTLESQRYYAIDFHNKSKALGKVYTYSGKHKVGNEQLNFKQSNDVALAQMPQKREFEFEFNNKNYQLAVDYSQQKINFYNSYPQLALKNYFTEDLPLHIKQQISRQLKPMLKGMSQQQSVNLLLTFVQTAFDYKTDDQQFNEENYLYPIETLHYPYSDCEDRSALFSWLVKNLLKLDVIILDYPGHVATAVALSSRVKGDAWQYQGKTYTVADPTYINATLGMTMPQFSDTAPKIVGL